MALRASLGLLGAATCYYQYDTIYRHERLKRTARTAWAAAQTIYDYKIDLDRHPELLSEIHARVAQRWYDLCYKNAGLFIKLGQSVSVQSHALPEEYTDLFAKLQDKAPHVDYEAVRRVVREDFGAEIEDLFETFDHEPIASASIAQVHQATLKTGEKVAVKVQKPNIADQLPYDLFCYRMLVYGFQYAFDLPISFFVNYVCENVTMEADFRVEAQNTIKAQRDLVGAVDRVYVPNIYTDMTRQRVLVQEWIDGVKINAADKLQALGISRRDVMNTVMNSFAYQIFTTGQVHSDPHPGNMIVRTKSERKGDFEVVIIDHGLYVQERPEFRQQYCRLWKAMVETDMDEIAAVTQLWGVYEPEMFASMQLFRKFGKRGFGPPSMRPDMTPEEMHAQQVAMKARVKLLLKDTSKIPLELVFLGRCMAILRGNNRQAGEVVDRVKIFANRAVEGLHSDSSASQRRWQVWSFQFRLWVLDALAWIYDTSNTVYTFLSGHEIEFEPDLLLDQALEEAELSHT
eukprot:m.97956 g.97956  ORF g.97956 m.97956 type:complete len:516 (-) comp13114_c0_seq1:407-1954(-)